MALDIPAIANRLNELASGHLIGGLQDIRTRLKHFDRRPGSKIFSTQTIFERWAFHHGGRTELQFNIGYYDGDNNDDMRHGVAFSFETGQTLPTIDVLVPKVKFFNDYIEANAEDFRDMRMWHYADGRSVDCPPGPIPSGLVAKGVFVFLGKRQPNTRIEYETILSDFDRLLALYQYVESGGITAPTPVVKNGFNFKPGCPKTRGSTVASLPQRELDIDLRHNRIRDLLYQRLASKYGKENVGAELPSGVGTRIDMVAKVKKEYWFYEIKTALTPRICLREAIGQLLEYGLWPGAHKPARYIVVGEGTLDAEDEEYLQRLRSQYSMPIEYESITI
jgi:hypothetical protein